MKRRGCEWEVKVAAWAMLDARAAEGSSLFFLGLPSSLCSAFTAALCSLGQSRGPVPCKSTTMPEAKRNQW